MAMPAEGRGSPFIWRVEMLGRFRAEAARPLPTTNPVTTSPQFPVVERFQTQKTGLLFALLALSVPRPLSRDELAGRLWADVPLTLSRDRLSQALSWLRRHFEAQVSLAPGAVIQADRQTIRLVPRTVLTDVAAFESGLAAASRAAIIPDPMQAVAGWEEAIALYRGPLLPGFSEEDDALFGEQQRLATAFEDALWQVTAICEQGERFSTAIAYARRLIALSPTDEKACALLLRLLTRTGEPDAALRVFAAFTRRVRAAQKEPSPTLRRLADEIRARSRAGVAAPAKSVVKTVSLPVAAMPSTERPASILPLTVTRYFGRQNDIQYLRSQIEERQARLLTLLGPGGCGKTRLALEVGKRFSASGDSQRRALFVALEGVQKAHQIIPAIWRTLCQDEQERDDDAALRESVVGFLHARAVSHPLVLLDNCEQLAGDRDTLAVLMDLLTRLPNLTLLATSRRRLEMEGEFLWTLSPLETPPASGASSPLPEQSPLSPDEDPLFHYASVQLFLDRARFVQSGLHWSSENRHAIATLCGRLEGLPLAIELCAAWAATLTPAQMLAELDRRFDLLVSRRPDVPARHRSMWAAVDTSFMLLPPELRRSFTRLSIFRGGWRAEAAQALLEGEDTSVLPLRDHLARLQEQSLILAESVRDPALPGETPAYRMRYRLLDTLREFAWEQITSPERDTLASQHAAYYLAFAEAAAPHLRGREQYRSLESLEAEHDNFRAALAYYQHTPGGTEDGLRLVIALRPFWRLRGYLREAVEWIGFFLSAYSQEGEEGSVANDRLDREAEGYKALGSVLAAQGDNLAARRAHETALTLWERQGNINGVAASLLEIGIIAYRQGNIDESHHLLTESLMAAEDAQNELVIAGTLLNLGSIAIDRSQFDQAKTWFERCLRLARRQDNAWLIVNSLNNLGEVARLQSDFAAATGFYEESLREAQALGSRILIALPLLNLSEIARRTGNNERAVRLMRESLLSVRDSGEGFLTAQCLFAAAVLADVQNRHERAALLLGGVTALQSAMKAWLSVSEPEVRDQLTDSLRAHLGDLRFEIAVERGARQPLEAIFRFALSEENDI